MIGMMGNAESNELSWGGFVRELVFGTQVGDDIEIGGWGFSAYQDVVNNDSHAGGGAVGFGAGV